MTKRNSFDPDVHESHVRNGVKVSIAGYTRGRLRDWYVIVSDATRYGQAGCYVESIIVKGQDQARELANIAFKVTATSSDPKDACKAAHNVAFPKSKEV